MEAQIENQRKELESLYEFLNTPEDVLRGEVDLLRGIQKDDHDIQSRMIAKLQGRHEASVQNTHMRCEKIINAAEDIACEVFDLLKL